MAKYNQALMHSGPYSPETTIMAGDNTISSNVNLGDSLNSKNKN
jgi:hypothetical protein